MNNLNYNCLAIKKAALAISCEHFEGKTKKSPTENIGPIAWE